MNGLMWMNIYQYFFIVNEMTKRKPGPQTQPNGQNSHRIRR